MRLAIVWLVAPPMPQPTDPRDLLGRVEAVYSRPGSYFIEATQALDDWLSESETPVPGR